MNEQYTIGMSELLELARDVRENPSQLHGGYQHKDAPSTPDFDWNVFVKRIDTMIAEGKIAPFRKIKLALNSLNADLTYENRTRAKALLHEVLELWERKSRENEQDVEFREQLNKRCLTSTYLTDEFWQKAVADSEKCKCKCPTCLTCLKQGDSKVERDSVLELEKFRYNQLLKLSLR